MTYRPIANAYRPQRFSDVLGQEAVVTTLKNALLTERLGNAYLFSGGRGTGKTTLARLLAKAMNCLNLSSDGEPCGQCQSCCEMQQTSSLDLIEIDGASHRSIDDIRQIRENVGYSPAAGRYKVYLIDEVHMLTKEAFNALLKTLEEPPAHVKFLFATTESHKLPATVTSRCQRFQLRRIAPETICSKLRAIVADLSVEAEESALYQIAALADGGLRDAESLLDQVISFHGTRVTAEGVAEVLGTTPQEFYFRLDRAMLAGESATAFTLVEELYTAGRDLSCFVDGLVQHVRRLLVVHLSAPSEPMVEEWRVHYVKSAAELSTGQWLALLDELLERQLALRTAPSQRIAVELLLLRYIQTRSRLPMEELVGRLNQLEQSLSSPPKRGEAVAPAAIQRKAEPVAPPPKKSEPMPPKAEAIAPAAIQHKVEPVAPPPKKSEPTPPKVEAIAPASMERPTEKTLQAQGPDAKKRQNRYDTLLRFAAVELEGTVQKNG
jgi:DNA polymerase III subunit gamma/tau